MDNKESRGPIQYASPVKRLWAWIGVVYMVMLVFFSTYAVACGKGMNGTLSLLLAPALIGLGGTAVLRYRAGQGRGGPVACVLVAGASFGLAVFQLIQGIPVLIAQL